MLIWVPIFFPLNLIAVAPRSLGFLLDSAVKGARFGSLVFRESTLGDGLGNCLFVCLLGWLEGRSETTNAGGGSGRAHVPPLWWLGHRSDPLRCFFDCCDAQGKDNLRVAARYVASITFLGCYACFLDLLAEDKGGSLALLLLYRCVFVVWMFQKKKLQVGCWFCYTANLISVVISLNWVIAEYHVLVHLF